MTDIPGTGKLQEKKSETEIPSEKITAEPVLITAVNVKQSKKPKSIDDEPQIDKRKKLLFVVLISFSISTLIFGFLSLFVFQFIYLIPIGLIVGIVVWGIKDSLSKATKTNDDIIRNSLS